MSLMLMNTAMVVSLSGCDLLQSATNNSSCSVHQVDYGQNIAQEGILSETITTPEPYPMALVFSQVSINALFAAVAGTDIPAIEIPISEISTTLIIYPELPLIQFGGVQNACPTCIVLGTAFGLDVQVAGLGTIGGSGDSLFSFPLFMQDAENLSATSVNAQFGQAAFVPGSLNIEITGVPSSIMNVAEPFIETALNIMVTESFGDTQLFDIEPWDIGDGDIKLLARGPHIYPDQETIVMGMHTNLFDTPTDTINPDPALPTNFDIGMQFHPALIEQMIGRLMHEGHIDRSYDVAGQADPEGDHQVTLNFMQGTEVMSDTGVPENLMRTNFRLWRTDGGFCGWADFQADFGLRISDEEVKLDVRNIGVTDGVGFGQLLMAAGDWLDSPYVNDVVNFSQLTVNYRDLKLPNNMQADMAAESFILSLDGAGLNIYLNLTEIFSIDTGTENTEP